MIQEILKAVLKAFSEKQEEKSELDKKIVSLVEEIDMLEMKRIKKLEDVEKWGDINDPSNWRTADYNKVRRMLEAKRKLLKDLRN